MSVSRGCAGREVVRMQPNSNLSWMGDLLTPELRSFARWAYVNASFIGLNSYANETNAAVMCSLYPCVQTYTTFISGNEVSETKVGSKVMQLDMLWKAHVPEQGDHNAPDDIYQSYTAIQSPCRAQGEVHDLYGNISAGVNSTELALYDFTDYGYPGTAQSTLVNITVPKECIYRQNPQFVKAVSRLLNYEIFSGSCTAIKTFNCRKAGSSAPYDKFLPGLGAETVLRALYGESYKSPSNLTTGLSNVTEWFDLFAEAMTRRFRTEYGSADEGDYRERDSPLDEIQGLAWQMTTCVSMRRVWLILPISLTVITAALAIWTIVTNWRHRHSRPVWKDSIFPFMFYGHDMVDGVLDRYNPDTSEQTSPGQKMNQVKEKNKPLENKRMKEISNSTAVTCSWLCAIDNSDGTPALTKRTCWSRQYRKSRKSTSDIQLLDTYENIEARSEIRGDQAVLMVAEPREDNQTLEVTQVDGDAQTPAVTQTHEREEAEPQQSQVMHLQACAYDHEGADDDADAHET